MLSDIIPNTARSKPKQDADIIAQMIVANTLQRFIPLKSTLNINDPTIIPNKDEMIAIIAGNRPFAKMRLTALLRMFFVKNGWYKLDRTFYCKLLQVKLMPSEEYHFICFAFYA